MQQYVSILSPLVIKTFNSFRWSTDLVSDSVNKFKLNQREIKPNRRRKTELQTTYKQEIKSEVLPLPMAVVSGLRCS